MNKFFIVLCFFVLNFIQAQSNTSLNITESEEYKDIEKAINILSIHTGESGFTGVVRDSKKNILFDVFDKDLKKVFSEVIESDKKEVFVGELFYDNQIKIFTVFSPKKSERIVYCHVFNFNDFSLKKEKLFETTVEKSQTLFSGNNKRQTGFAISPNGNFFAISTDNIKKNLNSYSIRLFKADNLDLIFKKSYLQDKERYFEPNDLFVDNSGTVYSLGKLFIEGKSQKRKGNANYNFVLNRIKENEVKNLTLNLDNEHIQSLVISPKNGKIHLLGFYSEKNVSRIKGGCNFIIDTKQFSVFDKKTFVLPNDVYQDLYGYRKASKKKDKELSRFYVDYVLFDDQGNTFLLAEEFYITSTYVSTGTGGGYWTYTYHYDDILILKFNKTGEIDWGRSIYKRATAPSYNAFLKQGKLHVILNSGKNLTNKEDGRTKVSKGWFESSALYDFVYSIEGEVSYNKIQNNKDKTFYLPFYGTYENDTFIMMSSARRKKQFMILE